jgi:hypothetical protein
LADAQAKFSAIENDDNVLPADKTAAQKAVTDAEQALATAKTKLSEAENVPKVDSNGSDWSNPLQRKDGTWIWQKRKSVVGASLTVNEIKDVLGSRMGDVDIHENEKPALNVDESIRSTFKVVDPSKCVGCDEFIQRVQKEIDVVQSTADPQERLNALSRAQELLLAHSEGNGIAFASGHFIVDKELYQLFGVGREDLIKTVNDNIAKINELRSQLDEDDPVQWRLKLLATTFSNYKERFNLYTDEEAAKLPTYVSDEIEKLAYYITGERLVAGEEIKLARRMADDHYAIKSKYGLPSREMYLESPRDYYNQLLKIAEQNNIPVRSGAEYQKFFDENPRAGAVYMDEGGGEKAIVVGHSWIDEGHVTDDLEILRTEARKFEHELTHALQDKRYPSMPIEVAEYEAYLTAIDPDIMLTNAETATYKVIGYYVQGSVENWYENNGITTRPWDSIEVAQPAITKNNEVRPLTQSALTPAGQYRSAIMTTAVAAVPIIGAVLQPMIAFIQSLFPLTTTATTAPSVPPTTTATTGTSTTKDDLSIVAPSSSPVSQTTTTTFELNPTESVTNTSNTTDEYIKVSKSAMSSNKLGEFSITVGQIMNAYNDQADASTDKKTFVAQHDIQSFVNAQLAGTKYADLITDSKFQEALREVDYQRTYSADEEVTCLMYANVLANSGFGTNAMVKVGDLGVVNAKELVYVDPGATYNVQKVGKWTLTEGGGLNHYFTNDWTSNDLRSGDQLVLNGSGQSHIGTIVATNSDNTITLADANYDLENGKVKGDGRVRIRTLTVDELVKEYGGDQRTIQLLRATIDSN